jgi:hypothetical protein
MRAAVVAACIALLALAACGDEPEVTVADRNGVPAVDAAERLCPELGKPGTDALYLARAEELVGAPFGEAKSLAQAHGCHVAAVRIDGESQPLTRQYDPTRIQVAVDDGKIARVRGFG